ncbi:MAG: pyridoxal phosphate-dependent aminotransferase [Syntrophaceae bacterium]|jgi:aspartate/methionine/tyrosine aminotransferase|nr:pyridoxal phosphate-dependent aminotransferase [Syntrophaceae bacterium]
MISKRASEFTSFIVMDVMAKVEELERKGEHIIHLEVGEPDFPTPAVITEAAIAALRNNRTRYTHALGLLELRQAICETYRQEYGVSITPDQVLVSTGTSPLLLFAMLALLDAGDEVIVSNPRYPCYQNFILAAGGSLQEILTYPEEGFQYRHTDIARKLSRRTKAIVINSPCNPTGIVMTREQMQDIARFDSAYIISDEIYHGLVYRGKAHSILEFTDKAFVINGFSKRYAMTGWRLGYLIFPRKFSAVMQRIHQNFMISANGFIQWAGIAALTQAADDVSAMVATYDERRRFMLERLAGMGFTVHVEPTGAFYVFADGRKLFADSYREAFRITEEAKVGVTPGIDFGSGGEGFLRFSYATSLENLKEGMNRLERYLERKK